jgi:hypothetical protein
MADPEFRKVRNDLDRIVEGEILMELKTISMLRRRCMSRPSSAMAEASLANRLFDAVISSTEVERRRRQLG